MNPNLIPEEDLKAWTGYQRRGDLEEFLRRHGLPEIKRPKQCPICGDKDIVKEGDHWLCLLCLYHWPIKEQECN